MGKLTGLHTLYISYNSIAEPLVRSQVLNYQERMVAEGVNVRLLTFEHQPPEDEAALKAELAGKGVKWDWLPYSGKKGARGTAADVKAGIKHILARKNDVDFVHCRSLIPAMMGYGARKFGGPRYLYDVRGFWAHEKRYKGRIKSDFQFKIARGVEALTYRNASALVTLSQAGMDILEKEYFANGKAPPRRVIPTCANIAPFMKPRKPLNAKAPRLVYSGSLGAGYMRDEVFAFFVRLRKILPESSLTVLTRSDPDMVREGAKLAGLSSDDYEMKSLQPQEMAEALLKCDLALSFIKPDFSKIASCPTKMGEYLAAGLPVIANGGIGDVDSQLGDTRTGAVIKDFSEAELSRAAEEAQLLLADPDMIERARKTAAEIFSLDLGAASYIELYAVLKDT